MTQSFKGKISLPRGTISEKKMKLENPPKVTDSQRT
jgi:hypothetical protein